MTDTKTDSTITWVLEHTAPEIAAYIDDLKARLAELIGEEEVPYEPEPAKCEHKDVLFYAHVGMGTCRNCGSNVSRDTLDSFEREVLTMAEIVGVSIPKHPIPLNPSIAISPKNFFGGSEELPQD